MTDDKYNLQVEASRMLEKRFKCLFAFPAALKKIIPVTGDPTKVWKSCLKTTEKRKLIDEDESNCKRSKTII